MGAVGGHCSLVNLAQCVHGPLRPLRRKFTLGCRRKPPGQSPAGIFCQIGLKPIPPGIERLIKMGCELPAINPRRGRCTQVIAVGAPVKLQGIATQAVADRIECDVLQAAQVMDGRVHREDYFGTIPNRGRRAGNLAQDLKESCPRKCRIRPGAEEVDVVWHETCRLNSGSKSRAEVAPGPVAGVRRMEWGMGAHGPGSEMEDFSRVFHAGSRSKPRAIFGKYRTSTVRPMNAAHSAAYLSIIHGFTSDRVRRTRVHDNLDPAMADTSYEHLKVEKKWQDFWDENQTFRTGTDPKKPKYYILDMFPYPSSTGLHVGHPEGYTATDIVARYKRAKGFNVLHPMGWDAFGLPAEQYALQTGVHPAVTTAKAVENFRRQLKMLGFSYDWNREVSTADPKYYKWTQFIFLKLFERGLAYKKEVAVNWCPALKTVLANDEVVDGKSERGGHPVERKPMTQWMLKITDYADRLLKDLDALDWPESTKNLQRNWIGKSEGLLLKFQLGGASNPSASSEIEVYTTRPDTLFGATYLVLAPEHPLVAKIVSPAQKAAVLDYCEEAGRKSEVARQEVTKDKTGVFTGAFAINPATGKPIPIWIADYVLWGYGTGAIMAVPAHDDRDQAFAVAFKLPIVTVIEKPDGEKLEEGECFTGEGKAINSGFISGMETARAKEEIILWAEREKRGKRSVQ